MWRVVTHQRSRATLEQVETHYSVEDLVDEHLVLDMFEELEARARIKARPAARPKIPL